MQQASKTNKVQSVQFQAKSSRSCPCSTHALRPLATLGLLVLPECPLSAPHDHSAVLTGSCGDFFDPVGRSLTYQFPT